MSRTNTNEAEQRSRAIKAYRRLQVLASVTTNETWRQYFAHQRIAALRDALKADAAIAKARIRLSEAERP